MGGSGVWRPSPWQGVALSGSRGQIGLAQHGDEHFVPDLVPLAKVEEGLLGRIKAVGVFLARRCLGDFHSLACRLLLAFLLLLIVQTSPLDDSMQAQPLQQNRSEDHQGSYDKDEVAFGKGASVRQSRRYGQGYDKTEN